MRRRMLTTKRIEERRGREFALLIKSRFYLLPLLFVLLLLLAACAYSRNQTVTSLFWYRPSKKILFVVTTKPSYVRLEEQCPSLVLIVSICAKAIFAISSLMLQPNGAKKNLRNHGLQRAVMIFSIATVVKLRSGMKMGLMHLPCEASSQGFDRHQEGTDLSILQHLVPTHLPHPLLGFSGLTLAQTASI